MSLHKDYDYRDDNHLNDFDHEEDTEIRHHRKRVRQMLEEHFERKRLKEEMDDIDSLLEDEFDWEHTDRK
jgi:hypothetical protein